MVKRVYGVFNNGPEIEFTQTEPNKWRVAIPSTPDGEYVASLFAEDDGGNTAYYATMLFAVSAHEIISMRRLPDYTLERLSSQFTLERVYRKEWYCEYGKIC